MPRAAILAATLALLATPAAALPPCPEISVVWTGCTGSFAFDDGAIYVGEWRNDKPSGQGTYTWPSGARYVGEWRDDKRHGQGTLTSPGLKFVGEWRDDRLHGRGSMYYPDGRILQQGVWIDGRFAYPF